jgi:hypothetical protein
MFINLSFSRCGRGSGKSRPDNRFAGLIESYESMVYSATANEGDGKLLHS